MDKQDINAILKADPACFDYEEASVALDCLYSAYWDLKFQLEEVPRKDFNGKDYESWRKSAAWKQKLIVCQIRRLTTQKDLVHLANEIKKLKDIIEGLVNGSSEATKDAIELLESDGD